MLQINMADVMNVVGSLVPYLVVIGVLLVLAHHHLCRQQEDGQERGLSQAHSL